MICDLCWKFRKYPKRKSPRPGLAQQGFFHHIQNIVFPKGNRAKGKVPRDANLSVGLRDVLKEYEKRIKPLNKALR